MANNTPLPCMLLGQCLSELKLYDKLETDSDPDKVIEPCLGWINNFKGSGTYSHIQHHKIQADYSEGLLTFW